ncbi:MAG: CDP-alcohol phosphatidyltransferase family protein [Acidimicrobiia bacterium]
MATVPSGSSGTPAVPALRFGPSALLTPANAITLLRFALTLPLLAVISADGASWRAWVGWCILASTDGLDGWLARRDGTTRSGAFLDPLADKFLAIGGLVALATQEVFPWLAVILIGSRELAVSAYRTWAGRRGVSMPARRLGKFKTVFQLVAVGVALCPLTDSPPWMGLAVLWVAVGLTLVSGLDLLRNPSPDAAPPPTTPT